MGVFIVVEGPEGAGKSTLVRWLAARLVAEGLQVTAVRQPGGTPVAEAARKVALKFPHEMSPVAELFLFLAARADLVQRVIRPALEAGQVVVADRFDLSTIAYQVAGGGWPSPPAAGCCSARPSPRGPFTSRRVCSRTCLRTSPISTWTRSRSAGCTRWRSTACSTSCTTRIRSF